MRVCPARPAQTRTFVAACARRLRQRRGAGVFDRLLFDFTLTTTLCDVVIPYLRQLGKRWEQGEITIAQQHFATNAIRGRPTWFARGWGDGHGRRAIVSCLPDELHDLPVLIFEIVLNRSGWRIDLLRGEHAGPRTGPPSRSLTTGTGRHGGHYHGSFRPDPRRACLTRRRRIARYRRSQPDAAPSPTRSVPTSLRRPCLCDRAPRAPLMTGPHVAHRHHGHVRTATCSSR